MTVADSARAQLLFLPPPQSAYVFPRDDVRWDLLQRTEHSAALAGLGSTDLWTVEAGGKTAESAAWTIAQPPVEVADMSGYVGFRWNRMDAWYEEDDEVFVHPRDPYHRVDVLNSSRRVEVRIEGEVVARTDRPRLLFETGLPTRYYIPKMDVRLDLLEPTDTQTRCPYKGVASYWSVRVKDSVRKDLVWGYEAPIPECPKIENLLCFFNEKVDIHVDGVLQERPHSPWS
ncbi:MAG: DUF427 domain-containing protein [Candidatus Dormibacteraeota bacterium]|nr:DUF427 domain-containing protein [Candidatus Dormibacteraeota bacterium]